MALKELYVLIDPRDGSVRYAGATSYRYLSSRLSVHVKMCHKNTSRCAMWVRELLAAEQRPIIQSRGRMLDWQQAERDLIASLRAAGADLLNMADGGLGVPGCKPSQETRAKRSATLKARYAKDPQQMAARQALARQAGKSEASRRAASERMTARWAARRQECR